MEARQQKPGAYPDWHDISSAQISILGPADAHGPGFCSELNFVSAMERMYLSIRSIDKKLLASAFETKG